MAQRLLRRICPECKKPYTPSAAEIKMLRLSPEYLANHQFYKGTGCKKCGHTGYKGRGAIFELLGVSERIGSMIIGRHSSAEIRKAAMEEGMATLRQDGWRKVFSGFTSVEELMRVTEDAK